MYFVITERNGMFQKKARSMKKAIKELEGRDGVILEKLTRTSFTIFKHTVEKGELVETRCMIQQI